LGLANGLLLCTTTIGKLQRRGCNPRNRWGQVRAQLESGSNSEEIIYPGLRSVENGLKRMFQHFEEKNNVMPKTTKKRLGISESKQNFGSVGCSGNGDGCGRHTHAQWESAVGNQGNFGLRQRSYWEHPTALNR
jgi:hypothetical protein